MKWCLFIVPLFLAVGLSTAAAQGEDDDSIYTGFIKKGPMTGNLYKLMNVNLFLAGRFSQIDNSGIDSAFGRDDADSVGVPGARLYLTGQVYSDLFYKVAYEFSTENDLDPADRNGRLTDAMLTWRIPIETDLLNRLEFNVGLGPIFLSPAGQEDLFLLDTIEHPLIVQNILPPGTARDEGIYFKGSFLDRDTIQVWGGLYNGAHRQIGAAGALPPTSFAVDAWGSSPGTDVDPFAYMGRIQVNVLNEEDYFFMVSGGMSHNRVLDGPMRRKIEDTLLDLATEIRFNDRLTWLKSEFIRTRTHHADDMYGFHVTAGHRIDFISEHLEVVARWDQQKLNDHRSSVDDMWAATFGVNYFFDPEHQHDGKFQLNYVVKETRNTDLARPFHGDSALALQFVMGF